MAVFHSAESPNSEFAHSVLQGLSASPKYLPSKYFYDQAGDKLFQRIMKLPEYYLSRCETEIISRYKESILRFLGTQAFTIVELGAGDGSKTSLLVEHFLNSGANFKYVPVDISRDVLDQLHGSFQAKFPKLEVNPVQSDYFKALADMSVSERKFVMFLGSSIGNFSKPEARHFLRMLNAKLGPQDLLFIGFDLKKDPNLLQNAYSDSEGVTREFNLNLLRRINRELGGSFDETRFKHYAEYEPIKGEMRSFLLSTVEQFVEIKALNRHFEFHPWEPVFTEVSAKYSLFELHELFEGAGFHTTRMFFDRNDYYTNVLLQKK